MGGDGMELFDLKVEPSHLHLGFKRLLDPNLAAERAVLSAWASGFHDRDKKFVKEFQTTFDPGCTAACRGCLTLFGGPERNVEELKASALNRLSHSMIVLTEPADPPCQATRSSLRSIRPDGHSHAGNLHRCCHIQGRSWPQWWWRTVRSLLR